MMTGIALAAIIFDGYLTTAEEFRDYLWLAAADIFGTVLGISMAIGAFAIVIWSYEKSLPLPENSWNFGSMTSTPASTELLIPVIMRITFCLPMFLVKPGIVYTSRIVFV